MAGGAEDEEAAAAALLQLLEEENERLARDRRNVAFPPSPARSQSAPLSAATSLSASATSLAVGSPPSPLPTDGHTARATTPAKPQAVAQASVANTNTNAKTQASDSDSLSPADIAAVAEERARVHAWSDTLPQLPQLLKKRPRRVVDLAAGGIPAALRCVAWQHLARARATLALGSATTGNTGDALSSATGSLSPHAESETAYPELLTRESRHERAIRRDIARTFPNHALFQESERERAAAAAQEAADAAGSMDSCSESGDEDEGDDETEPRSAPSEVPSEAAGGSTSAAEEEHRETDTTAVKRDCAADSDLTAAEKAHTEHTDHSQDTEAATLAPGGAVSEPCSGRTSAGSATTTDESHTQQHSRRRHRPQQPRLPEGRGQATLFNVLKAYSLYDPEVGYCQGSPFIAGVLLMHMPEEDAFNTLTLLMRHYALRGLFTPDMADLPLRLHQLECLVAQTLPDVHAHFTALGLAPSMYASSWFLTLFSSSLPLPLVFRIVDVFLVEGLPALFRAALALLSLSRLTLVADSFENALHSLTRAEALARFAGREEEFMRASRAFSFSEKSLARWESEYQRERQAEQQRNSALGRAEAERDRLAAENTALRKQLAQLEEAYGTLAKKHLDQCVLLHHSQEEVEELSGQLHTKAQQPDPREQPLLRSSSSPASPPERSMTMLNGTQTSLTNTAGSATATTNMESSMAAGDAVTREDDSGTAGVVEEERSAGEADAVGDEPSLEDATVVEEERSVGEVGGHGFAGEDAEVATNKTGAEEIQVVLVPSPAACDDSQDQDRDDAWTS